MMQSFGVQVMDRVTGEERILTIPAESAEDASQQAAAAGWVVGRVSVIHPSVQPELAPAPAGPQIVMYAPPAPKSGRVLAYFAGLITGVVLTLGGVAALAWLAVQRAPAGSASPATKLAVAHGLTHAESRYDKFTGETYCSASLYFANGEYILASSTFEGQTPPKGGPIVYCYSPSGGDYGTTLWLVDGKTPPRLSNGEFLKLITTAKTVEVQINGKEAKLEPVHIAAVRDFLRSIGQAK